MQSRVSCEHTGGLGKCRPLTLSGLCPHSQVDAAVKKAVEQHGRLSGVAHCVGSIVLKPAHTTTDAEWADVSGCVYVCVRLCVYVCV